ncbi:MAG: DUF4166 domain-containing protein [Gammaproteobacteria bacterium]|nr:DUF4166 domain-containing protein [Gammaproteobacteria bacterium]
MNDQSLMQKALGDQWQQLPPALQSHYQHDSNSDIGYLNIDYPIYMHPYLTFLHLFGVLINRRGKNIPTTVEKQMQGHIQFWKRTICFSGNKTILFNSFWIFDRKNELIEFINPFIGLRMTVQVQNDKLYYEGCHFVIKIGKLLIPVPEWLVLGHTTIIETALSNDEFEMNFTLKHPIFGNIFSYEGKFKTIS